MVNPTGYTALDFIGFTDKGTYAANVNYVKNDLVHYGGNIWKVLVDDTIGITPAEGTSYTLFIGEPTNLVERIIAPLEENPATIAYGVGRQIIYNNYLYEVVKNIAVGDILVAYEDDPTNANIKLASPVETQVLELNASKVNKSDIANNVTTTTAGKVLDARQGKALQDGINTKVNKSDVVNNVTTTAEGKVLDARQGKALQDGINTKVNKSDVVNNVTTTAEGKVLDARQGKALQDGKTDNSVIAPVESGATASRAYAAGAHFIKNGAFCTAKTAIAQGETFTLNTNYTAGTIGQELYKIGEIVNATYPSDRTTRNINTTGGAIVAQITLTPGKWIMNEGAYLSGLTAESSTIHGYVNNTTTAITSVATLDNTNGSIMTNLRNVGGAIALSGFVEIVQTTTFYYKIYNGNGGYNSGGCKFRAMRIA